MVYCDDVSLCAFLSSLAWTRPEDHVEIILVTRDKDGENDYEDIPCNVYYTSKYANYKIDNIMIEDSETISVMIHVNDQ